MSLQVAGCSGGATRDAQPTLFAPCCTTCSNGRCSGKGLVESMGETTPKTKGGRRPGAGRPATGFAPVRTVRMSNAAMARVDSWASRQDDQPGRSEAIRRLVELGLTLDRVWYFGNLSASLPASALPATGSAPLSPQAPTEGREAANWPPGDHRA